MIPPLTSPIASSSAGSRPRLRQCVRARRPRRAQAGRRRRDRPAASPRPRPPHPCAALGQQRATGFRSSDSGASPNSTRMSSMRLRARDGRRAPRAGAHRVAGAERRVLDDALGRSDEPATASIRGPITTTVAAGVSGCKRRQQMRDHRPAGNRVHHLRDRRFHPRAAAGGEDDGGESGSAHQPLGHGQRGAASLSPRGVLRYNTQIVTNYSTGALTRPRHRAPVVPD